MVLGFRNGASGCGGLRHNSDQPKRINFLLCMVKGQLDKPVRIALDCRYIGARPSGIGEAVGALVRHLPDLAPDCTFTLLRNPLRREPLSTAANVREVVVQAAANGPVSLLHLPLAVDLAGTDLFHAPANILPGGLRMPAITTIHDIMWLTHPDWCNSGLWGRVERRFYRHGIARALSRSAAVATVSAASRDAICDYAPQMAGRVAVTRSGVAEDFVPAARNDTVLAQFGLRPGRRYCLIVGQGAPYKNHDTALRAFAAAFADRDELDLVLVRRRGANGAALEQVAATLGIGARVHMLPTVTRAQLVQLYASAEMLLHPSLCEGFGNPVAEAMACGCPVVTSDRSAMPEVADGAAVLVDPYDINAIAAALRRVMDDRALREAMRASGLARAAMLDWRAFAADNLALYRRVLERVA